MESEDYRVDWRTKRTVADILLRLRIHDTGCLCLRELSNLVLMRNRETVLFEILRARGIYYLDRHALYDA